MTKIADKIKNLDLKELKDFHVKDIQERSITPRTHQTRDFNSDLLGDNNDKNYYIDLYQHVVEDVVRSEVRRFAINHYKDNLLNAVNLEPYNQLPTQSLSAKTKDKNFEIDQWRKYSSENITDIEKKLINQAINYLKVYDKNTVLVDFFARNTDGSIRSETKQDRVIPEIHTVVIYKQYGNDTNKYLVIDPSNTCFSYILSNVADTIRLCFHNNFQIYQSHKDINDGKTGPSLDQWRDCVDIAAKLAFSFNKNLDKITLTSKNLDFETIDFDSLSKSDSIKEITNQTNSYEKLPYDIKTCTVRAKQSSDIQEIKLTTFYLKLLKEKNNLIQTKLDESNLDPYHMKKKYNEMQKCAIANIKNHNEYIKYLNDSISFFNEALNKINDSQDYIEQQEVSIIGDSELNF